MPIPLSELFAGCLLPAALSLGLWLFGATLLRSTKSTWIQDWILPLSLGIGFLPGYALLGLAPWQAESHWHYWVYALLWVALVSPLVQRLPSNIVVRWLAMAALFVPVAWILTPKWELDFTKWLYVPLVIVLMTGWR